MKINNSTSNWVSKRIIESSEADFILDGLMSNNYKYFINLAAKTSIFRKNGCGVVI